MESYTILSDRHWALKSEGSLALISATKNLYDYIVISNKSQ